MKKIKLIILILLIFPSISFSQKDSTKTYISCSISNTTCLGTQFEKINSAFEIGKEWSDVFSLGICGGFTSGDKYPYIELRPNLNIFQTKDFINTFTCGIGYVFDYNDPEERNLIELTYGIEYCYSKRKHINLFFGQYYYTGKSSSSTLNFIGFSYMIFFKE